MMKIKRQVQINRFLNGTQKMLRSNSKKSKIPKRNLNSKRLSPFRRKLKSKSSSLKDKRNNKRTFNPTVTMMMSLINKILMDSLMLVKLPSIKDQKLKLKLINVEILMPNKNSNMLPNRKREEPQMKKKEKENPS